jgi:hypothetical protein
MIVASRDYLDETKVDPRRSWYKVVAPVRTSLEPVNDVYGEVIQELLARVNATATTQRFSSLDEKLSQIGDLPDHWDGYDSPRPDENAVTLARQAIRAAEIARLLPTTVVASAEGGVAICWDKGDKHAYIEFGNDLTAVSAMYSGHGEPIVAEFEPTASEIERAFGEVRRFMRI